MPWAVYRICLQGLRFSWGLWSPGATPTIPNCPKPHPVQKEKTSTFSSGGTQALMWSQLPIKLLCSTHTSQPRSALISSCRIPTVHFSWCDGCCGKFWGLSSRKQTKLLLRRYAKPICQCWVASVAFMSSFLRLTDMREDEKALRISKATLAPGARSEARE